MSSLKVGYSEFHEICRTLDGKNILHNMGIIRAFTLQINVEAKIRRTNVTEDDIAEVGRINISSITSNTDMLSSMRYEHISVQMITYSHSTVDFLGKLSRKIW